MAAADETGAPARPDSEPCVFETERLRAVQWRVDLAPQAFEMYGDPEVCRFIGSPMESVAVTRERIERILEQAPGLPPGMGSFPLLAKHEVAAPLVGTAMIQPLPDAENQPTKDIEIGWHVLRARWGGGYASEAGQGLLRLGFETLGLERLHAVVHIENEASHAVARRIGMLVMGTTHAYYGGIELVHYQLERERWRFEAQWAGR